MKDNVLIDNERGGCYFTVRTSESFENIRKDICDLENINSELLLLPSEISWGPGETYSFQIRHRRTLKDFLSNNDLTLINFYIIIEKINELINFTNDNKIDIRKISFDYNGIFIGLKPEHVNFTYIPGNNDNFSKCYELITLLVLHINYMQGSQEEEIIKKLLEILDSSRDNENIDDFSIHKLLECIKPYLPTSKKKITNVWIPFISFEIFSSVVLILILCNFRYNPINIFISVISICLIISISLILIPKKLINNKSLPIPHNKDELIKDNYMNKQNSPVIIGINKFKDTVLTLNKEIVNLGRDRTWSDLFIQNLNTTRKHAEIHEVEGKYFLKDLSSLNGSFLNGRKLKALSLTELKHGDLISLGDIENVVFKFENNFTANV